MKFSKLKYLTEKFFLNQTFFEDFFSNKLRKSFNVRAPVDCRLTILSKLLKRKHSLFLLPLKLTNGNLMEVRIKRNSQMFRISMKIWNLFFLTSLKFHHFLSSFIFLLRLLLHSAFNITSLPRYSRWFRHEQTFNIVGADAKYVENYHHQSVSRSLLLINFKVYFRNYENLIIQNSRRLPAI